MSTREKTLADLEDERETTADRVARRNEPAQDERLDAIEREIMRRGACRRLPS
jgi:hypothetical protein